MIRHCSRCREENDTDGRYCRRCRANYMRDWRKAKPASAYRNIHCIASRETTATDPETDHLAAAVADLCDELAVIG